MRRALIAGLALHAFAGCSGDGSMMMVVKDPPRVFLTAPESTQIAPTLKVSVNVSGCEKVQGLEIYSGSRFVKIAENLTSLPVAFEILPAELGADFAMGIAAHLTLLAKATCKEDGRQNTSVPLGVVFFPVASVVGPVSGAGAALPDSFYAEGGVAGAPTTFVGCIGGGSGTALARVDTTGRVLKVNPTPLPFPCSIFSQISDRTVATGTRWLFENDVGAFSFDLDLNVLSVVKGNITAFGVAHDGDALTWDRTATSGPALSRIAAKPTGASNVVWTGFVNGIMANSPITDASKGSVLTLMWRSEIGSNQGTLVVQRLNYANGAALGENTLDTIAYGALDTPVIPASVFSPQGDIVYFSYQGSGSALQSGLLACPTLSTGCSTGSKKWQSALFDGIITAALPYSNGSIIAAVSANQTRFFAASSGFPLSTNGIKAQGSLQAQAVQPGVASDFYMLSGPKGGYPTELIAVDAPDKGEVYRLTIEGGQTPLSALSMAIDEGGTPWLRVGPNQVKPLPLSQYRTARGATPNP